MRLLFLMHPGTNSRDIFLDMIEGYRQAGHEAILLELGPTWQARESAEDLETNQRHAVVFAETLQAFVAFNRIDACVSMWGNGVEAAPLYEGKSFFEHIRRPILMHWLDAPQWADSPVLETPAAVYNGPFSFHIINNEATASEMAGVLGFENIFTVGNAASPSSFRPRPVDKKDFDIVFAIGSDNTQPTDRMLAELERDEPNVAAIRTEQVEVVRPRLREILSDTWKSPGSVDVFLDRVLAVRMDRRDAPVLEQVSEIARTERDLAPGILGLLEDRNRYVKFSMTLRTMENWERAFTFVYLARHFRCATFGLSRPFTAWPGRWEHLGELPYTEQSAAYSRSWFGLNVMRWQDDVGLNLKPFEITLSGAALLQGYRSGIEKYFDASQAVVFRTPQEARARVSRLLADSDEVRRIAVAGRTRSLAQHTWKHRIEALTKLFSVQRKENDHRRVPSTDEREQGDNLIFVLGLPRTGTTLLRKILDSHSEVYAPAETWFLLPLLNLWVGKGSAEGYLPSQAAAAVHGHVSEEQFLACSRAFAARFYAANQPAGVRYFVDKTPLYVNLIGTLPRLFPKARFLVITRDPRGTVWSRHTWKHITSRDPEEHFKSTAEGTQRLATFLTEHSDRSLHVLYERLCTEPESAVPAICEWLGLVFEPAMIHYGKHAHHEGYGDEKTRDHARPHTDAMNRWKGPDGLTDAQQSRLAEICGRDLLTQLGYDELAHLAAANEPVPAGSA